MKVQIIIISIIVLLNLLGALFFFVYLPMMQKDDGIAVEQIPTGYEVITPTFEEQKNLQQIDPGLVATESGDTIEQVSWEKIVQIMSSCTVRFVTVGSDGTLIVTVKVNQKMQSKEPVSGDAINLVQSTVDTCEQKPIVASQ